VQLSCVLLIEDNDQVGEAVINEFKVQDVEVVRVTNYMDLEKRFSSLPLFQMVILDWLLDGETEGDALLCLTKLREIRFVPVVIYTEEIGKFLEAKADVKSRFPEGCFQGFGKGDVNHAQLLQELSRWYEQPPARLAEQFRRSVATAVEQTLYTLAEQSIDDLTKGLKTLIDVGDGSDVDMEHAADVMLRLMGRQLYRDAAFTNELKQIVSGLETSNPQPSKTEKQRASQMEALFMYYQPSDNIVRNGDIVKINGDDFEKLAIILTPACDLANPDKTSYLRLAVLNLQATRKGSPPADRWPLTYDTQTYEVCFHETLAVLNKSVSQETANKSVMLYTHKYEMATGITVSLTRECRLDEPYRADLLHSFVSHAGRVGRPDFTG
jgi:hypothetical protein